MFIGQKFEGTYTYCRDGAPVCPFCKSKYATKTICETYAVFYVCGCRLRFDNRTSNGVLLRPCSRSDIPDPSMIGLLECEDNLWIKAEQVKPIKLRK